MGDEAKAINYRLSNIEKTLAELKDVVIETKLQQKDIDDLKSKEDEILNAVNCHDQRLRILENRPTQERANRWTTITEKEKILPLFLQNNADVNLVIPVDL